VLKPTKKHVNMCNTNKCNIRVFFENIPFILIKFNSVFTLYFRESKDVQDTEKVHKIVSSYVCMKYVTLRRKPFFCYVTFYQNYKMLLCKIGLGKKINNPDSLNFNTETLFSSSLDRAYTGLASEYVFKSMKNV